MSGNKAPSNGNGVDFPIIIAWAFFVFLLYKAWIVYGRPWFDRTFSSLGNSDTGSVALGMDTVDIVAILVLMLPLLLALIAFRRAAKRRKMKKSLRND